MNEEDREAMEQAKWELELDLENAEYEVQDAKDELAEAEKVVKEMKTQLATFEDDW